MQLFDVAAATDRAIIDAFVGTFVVGSRRSRWRQLLSSKNGRDRLRATLVPAVDFDPKYLKKLGDEATADDAYYELSSNNAPDHCYVISADSEIDGTKPALADVIESVFGSNQGTILICDPTRLAFFESEENGERFVMLRS